MDKKTIYFIFKLLDPRQLNIVITNVCNIRRNINKNTKDNVWICHVKRIRNGKGRELVGFDGNVGSRPKERRVHIIAQN
jgi:hypothetical protein